MNNGVKFLCILHDVGQASATYGTRGTIFNSTLSELKYSNYDLIKIESLIK